MQKGQFNEAAGPWDHLKQIGDLKDSHEQPLVTPKQMLGGLRLPQGFEPNLCYLVWPKGLVRQMVSQGLKLKSYEFFYYSLECLEVLGHMVAVVAMPMGAAAAVMVLEELVYLGFQKFVGIGTAGGIHTDLKSGDLCILEQAIIDEGVSAHYGVRDFFSHGSFVLMNQVQKVLEQQAYTVRRGCIWTTDAPYRETLAKLAFMKKKQILGVDMETSALFTVARHHKVLYTGLVGIADQFAGDQWLPCPNMAQVQQNLSSCSLKLLQNLF